MNNSGSRNQDAASSKTVVSQAKSDSIKYLSNLIVELYNGDISTENAIYASQLIYEQLDLTESEADVLALTHHIFHLRVAQHAKKEEFYASFSQQVYIWYAK